MMRTIQRGVVVGAAVSFAVLLGCSAHRVQAGEHCFYKGSMYSEGAAACQHGTQYRCSDEGSWASTGMACTDQATVAAKSCEAGGISYLTGSASCQAGTQFRCEDGAWKNIGVPCTLGDSPIKVVPSGRTCMFDDATVANGSTVCRSGLTQLCSDGAWVSLGTLCR